MELAEIAVAGGVIGICPMPGRSGHYQRDLACVLAWEPVRVVTLTALGELAARKADRLPTDLAAAGVEWSHLPIPDFGTPKRDLRTRWLDVSYDLRGALERGRVLIHCMGGCGRSGMIALRLMVDAGEAPDVALARLRAVRPCAVETKAQLLWATTP